MEPLTAAAAAVEDGAASDDSEYEYEYDASETETFYLNLDLTTCNGPVRPPRKRSGPSPPVPSTPSQPPPSSTGSRRSSIAVDDERTPTSLDSDLEFGERIQILDLHSRNPVISYQNQIFTCHWADSVGTELFFSQPEESAGGPVLVRDRSFDMISANRFKIVGQKAYLISSAETKVGTAQQRLGVPPTVRRATSTNQERFLRRIMAAKQARGERDAVRTTFSTRKSQNLEARLQGWARTGQQMAELDQLNQRAQQGDMNALATLEGLYRVQPPSTSQAPTGDGGIQPDPLPQAPAMPSSEAEDQGAPPPSNNNGG